MLRDTGKEVKINRTDFASSFQHLQEGLKENVFATIQSIIDSDQSNTQYLQGNLYLWQADDGIGVRTASLALSAFF